MNIFWKLLNCSIFWVNLSSEKFFSTYLSLDMLQWRLWSVFLFSESFHSRPLFRYFVFAFQLWVKNYRAKMSSDWIWNLDPLVSVTTTLSASFNSILERTWLCSKNCQWLDLNCQLMETEVTTMPQTRLNDIVPWRIWIK